MAARIVPVTNSGSAISASEMPEMAWSGSCRVARRPSAAEDDRHGDEEEQRRTGEDEAVREASRDEARDGLLDPTEWPRSPCSTPEIHVQYCSQSGVEPELLA